MNSTLENEQTGVQVLAAVDMEYAILQLSYHLRIAESEHNQCVNSNFLQSSAFPHLGAWTKLHPLQIHTQPTPRHQQSDIPATSEKHLAEAMPTNCLQVKWNFIPPLLNSESEKERQ